MAKAISCERSRAVVGENVLRIGRGERARYYPVLMCGCDTHLVKCFAGCVHFKRIVIMRRSVSFPKDIEDRLLAYRKARKAETGKMMFRESAITELLRVALEGFQPPKPMEERLRAIEKRLTKLEFPEKSWAQLTADGVAN